MMIFVKTYIIFHNIIQSCEKIIEIVGFFDIFESKHLILLKRVPINKGDYQMTHTIEILQVFPQFK